MSMSSAALVVLGSRDAICRSRRGLNEMHLALDKNIRENGAIRLLLCIM